MRRAVVAALALWAALAVGCSDGGPGPGEGRLVVDGAAVVRSGGDEERVTGSRDLRPGDEVEMVEGSATVELADEVVLELREGRGEARSSEIRMETVPVLLRGDLLVVAGGAEPAAVDAAGSTLAVERGAARISRALNVQAGVYAGAVSIASAARQAEVPALHEVAVPALGLVGRARPLQLDPRDEWDRRLLGDVIQLSDELDRRAQGFTSQAGAAATDPAFYLTRFTRLSEGEEGVRAAFRPGRSPGDHLIGAAITDLGERGSVSDRYARVFRFRADGASWGLVAKREGVERGPLLERVDEVIAGPGLELALVGATSPPPGGTGTTTPGPATVSPTTAPGPPATSPGGGPGTTSPGGPPPTQPPPTSPTPTLPPTTLPPPILPLPTLPPPTTTPPQEGQGGPLPTTGTPLDPVVDPIDDLLGQLLP